MEGIMVKLTTFPTGRVSKVRFIYPEGVDISDKFEDPKLPEVRLATAVFLHNKNLGIGTSTNENPKFMATTINTPSENEVFLLDPNRPLILDIKAGAGLN